MIVIKKNNKKTVQIGIDIHKYIDFVLKVYMRYTPELVELLVYFLAAKACIYLQWMDGISIINKDIALW